jgi:TrmH family RNA methyltransferase
MSSSLQSTIRDLHLRRGRERRGLALAEGVRLLEEALAAGVPVRGAAVSPHLEGTARGLALKAALERAGVRLEPVSDRELDALADTDTPQGIVAVIEPPTWGWAALAPTASAPLLVLAGVQDPGNVGTILRSALALGAAGVVALKGTAELHNPKVVRGSMGALFRLPSVSADAADFLAWAASRGVELWAAEADGMPVSAAPRPSRPLALVVGNEGGGVPAELLLHSARKVAVPLAAGVESLNVAVAAAILLYEVTRAR